MSGWVRIDRDFLDHPLFAGQQRSKGEAFLWLVSHAAWAPSRHRIGMQCHDVPRGSLFVTLRQLATAWNWGSDTRVRTFLRALEGQMLIVLKGNARKTQISICNYELYCGSGNFPNARKTQTKRIKDNSINITLWEAAAKKPEMHGDVLAILCPVLDLDHAEALIRHRAAMRKPLTAQAARLLATKFARCADPATAVDTMIAHGWQGFEPHWLERFLPPSLPAAASLAGPAAAAPAMPAAAAPARPGAASLSISAAASLPRRSPPPSKRNIGDAFVEQARRLGVTPDENQSADAWRADFIAERVASARLSKS